MHNRSKWMCATSKGLNNPSIGLKNPSKGIRDSQRGMNYDEHSEGVISVPSEVAL